MLNSFAVRELVKDLYSGAVVRWRDYSPKGRAIARKRAAVDAALDRIARSSPARFSGTVLVDAMWDNPNYWLRFSLLRAALGLAHGREIGVLGQYRQPQCKATLTALGIRTAVSFPRAKVPGNVEAVTQELLTRTRTPEDILKWALPGGVHPAIAYDGILKRQRLASIDVTRNDFAALTREAVESIMRGIAVLDETRPDLVVISHPLNVTYGALAWSALSRGIPVVLPYGLFGVLRFTRFAKPEDLFAFYDRPTRAEIDALGADRAAAMAEIGREYLERRLAGRADDNASVYAFQRSRGQIDRAEICRLNGWDASVPIVAFYASNWFDWPHQLGMTQFRDFLDWTETTFTAAARNRTVNWLFKPHPAEDWFGGVALSDIMARIGQAPNVAVSDKAWNNAAVMRSIDAMVTYHGTAGVEFAALGKPVLVPDRGKYHDCGFVKLAEDRADYVALLGRRWWEGMDMADVRRRAEIYAGWWFCAPDWQGKFILPDDSRQDPLYDLIPGLLANNSGPLARELEQIAAWWNSGHGYYHTYKMMHAERFQLSNV